MRLSHLAVTVFILTLTVLTNPVPAVTMDVSYLFTLSNFTGAVPTGEAVLHVDRASDEAYAALRNDVRVFNRTGMEIYQFDLNDTQGRIFGLAVDEAGDILLLTLDLSRPGRRTDWWITRCDYRGAVLEQLSVSGLPPDFDGFVPNTMFYRDGSFILASTAQKLVAVVDLRGQFLTGYDLAELLKIEEKKRADTLLTGFNIDSRGNMIFTIATLFRAFVVTPDGEVMAFGRGGSVPGSFGVAANIVADEYGHYLVADKLRRVVIVFDREFRFLTEFGDGKVGGVWLSQPGRLAFGNNGTVYVTQPGSRGIAVFKLETGGEVIRLDSGPQTRGGAVRGGELSNEPGQSATETSSVAGLQTKPPVTPSGDGLIRLTGPVDHRVTGIPETQRGDEQ